MSDEVKVGDWTIEPDGYGNYTVSTGGWSPRFQITASLGELGDLGNAIDAVIRRAK